MQQTARVFPGKRRRSNRILNLQGDPQLLILADADLEARKGGGGGGVGFLALLALFPSVICSLFTQHRGGRGGGGAPLDPPLVNANWLKGKNLSLDLPNIVKFILHYYHQP